MFSFNRQIFSIKSQSEFEHCTLQTFRFQADNNPVYKKFLNFIGCDTNRVKHISNIPFMPVEFFKYHNILTGSKKPKIIFSSSGTTGVDTSRHGVADPAIYHESLLKGFSCFYGSPGQYIILALLPSYLEREGSSLVYMVNKLIALSGHSLSGFFLSDTNNLLKILKAKTHTKKLFLWGVSFALLDLAEKYEFDLSDAIVMETGGMKGRREEITRIELHEILCRQFHCNTIHSEYGMTELLSQAYSTGRGIFRCPPWMKILVRDTNDPFTILKPGLQGGINVIDLANIYSCSFIATSDLGKVFDDGSFEISGRFDNSDIRGCNLLI